MKKATRLEKFAGNTGTQAALTVIGAMSGGPLGALLPVLCTSLASTRQKARVEECLRDIYATLRAHSEAIQQLSDPQYQLINESILALLHTTDAEKIRYLRYAVRNIIDASEILPQEAVVLARVIRDISADEARFLIDNFQYQRVQFRPATGEIGDDKDVLSIPTDSHDALVVTGLIALGLLSSPGPIMKDLGRFSFSPIVAKLLVLLRNPN